jgi:lipopolysaccharide biosynthesis regulator YciM
VELAATLAQPVVREAPSVRGATMAEVMAGYARVVLAADDWEEARAAALRAIATHESRERVAILFGLLGDKEGDLQRAVRASRGGEG